MPLDTYPTFERPSNISVVDGCGLMADFAPLVRGTIASHAFMAYAERDETIWTEGSPSDFIAIVGSGSVRLTRRSSNENETAIATLGPGGCFGREAVCEGSVHQANAIAGEHTWYLKVPAEVVILLLCDRPRSRHS